MFSDCRVVHILINVINQFCSLQWSQPEHFNYYNIPHLLSEYSPQRLIHTAMIRAVWLTWCEVFYESPLSEQVFIDTALSYFRKEIRKRINEAPSIAQWIGIIDKRRTSQEFEGVSEKEFLLRHATSVKKCYEFLIHDKSLELVKLWHGKRYFFEVVEDTPENFKLDIRHDKLNSFFEDYGSLPLINIDLVSDHPATNHIRG